MELFKWVLTALMSLPVAYVDRDETGRDVRMNTIARAVTEVAERASCSGEYESEKGCVRIWNGSAKQLAALLVTKGWWESRFAKHVHEGQCKADECDAVVIRGVVVHRARSPWQLQKTGYSAPEWDQMGPTFVGTRAAAWAATKVLVEGRRRCGGGSFGVLSWYGRQRCSWKGALNRDRTYKRLMEGN